MRYFAGQREREREREKERERESEREREMRERERERERDRKCASCYMQCTIVICNLECERRYWCTMMYNGSPKTYVVI